MAAVALTLDDPRYINGLRFAEMDSPDTLGRRLLAAVIPSRFKDLNALHLATGIAYSTVHKWKTGDANPRWEQVETVARLVGENPFRMLSPGDKASSRERVADHPEWEGAKAAALDRFPGRVPAPFYEIAGETSGASIPEHIDEHFAFELASFWFKHASDDEVSRADTAAAARELESLRASTKRPRE